MKIDLRTIDRTQFDVRGEDRVLITPRKDKHVWEDHELWLRSVVTDADGEVISMGFPKFMNLHERPEYHMDALVSADKVFAWDKADGSMIALTYIDGEPYLRTRGSLELGEFHDPVMAVIRNKYPQLLLPPATIEELRQGELRLADHGNGYTDLFEYVAPDNRIVLAYQEPDLIFMATVMIPSDPDEVPVVLNSPDYLEGMKFDYGLTIPKLLSHSRIGVENHMDIIPTWGADRHSEGMVVTCFEYSGDSVLFKVKCQWYLMMHALRFQMNARKLRMLLTLEWEQLSNFETLKLYLFELGYDFEVTEFLETEAEAYFGLRREAIKWQGSALVTINSQRFERIQIDRGMFVREFKMWMIEVNAPDWTFHYAMAHLDNKLDSGYYPLAAAAEESVRKVADWFQNREETIRTLIKTPEDFIDEEDV